MRWNEERILALFELPFFELVNQAYSKHKEFFDPRDMEFCTLSSIKTGACPEDCAYCPQSAYYNTGVKREKLLDIKTVLKQAQTAKESGARRFCMGAAWRSPPEKGFVQVLDMIKEVKKLGLETCVTLGMLTEKHAQRLKEAGLDFYNHNLDTSPEYYQKIITTRIYQERLDTLNEVAKAGIHICTGGILGMGESRLDRVKLLLMLYQLPQPLKSVTINKLIPIPGTPLEHAEPLDHFELVRVIAIARLMFPQSHIRLSAGREDTPEEVQALCFMAGVNSIFIGNILLTAHNATPSHDVRLLEKLGMRLPDFAIPETG